MPILVRGYSDIHLDHYDLGSLWYPPPLPTDKDTILILAGDLWIGYKFITVEDYSHKTVVIDKSKPRQEIDGRPWIEKVASRFKQVLIVLGNHDYWPTTHALTIRSGAERCNALLQDRGIQNVKVLDCDIHECERVLFVGCTLWTDMDKSSPLAMHNMPKVMRYDGSIAYETGPNGQWSRFTSEKWVQTHCKHRDYINLIAKQNPSKQIVVITHHLPLYSLGDPRYAGGPDDAYYASDLSNLILDNLNITHWFYGHTHYQKDTISGNCRLINNCVGYKAESYEARGFVKHEPILIG